jgi:hypothetical protein
VALGPGDVTWNAAEVAGLMRDLAAAVEAAWPPPD